MEFFAEQAEIFKALAQESRLRIVHHLGRGDLTVGELTGLVGLDPSTVSRHLGVLRNSGIIASRRQGKSVVCRLAMPCVLNFFTCANDVLRQSGGPANRARPKVDD